MPTCRRETGFTLIELMIVVVVIGILAAIAIPNFLTIQNRAKEGSTKSNMHTFQLAVEDYYVQNSGTYSPDCAGVAPYLNRGGANFVNPFKASDAAFVDGPAWAVPLPTGSTIAGITAYQDSVQAKYQVAGRGSSGDLSVVLTSGP